MSIDNHKALIRRYITELNQRHIAAIDALVVEDFRPRVRQGYTRNVTAFPDYHVQVEEMIAEGDTLSGNWREVIHA